MNEEKELNEEELQEAKKKLQSAPETDTSQRDAKKNFLDSKDIREKLHQEQDDPKSELQPGSVILKEIKENLQSAPKHDSPQVEARNRSREFIAALRDYRMRLGKPQFQADMDFETFILDDKEIISKYIEDLPAISLEYRKIREEWDAFLQEYTKPTLIIVLWHKIKRANWVILDGAENKETEKLLELLKEVKALARNTENIVGVINKLVDNCSKCKSYNEYALITMPAYKYSIIFLMKHQIVKLVNPYNLLLTDDQWFVWYLKEIKEFTYDDIAEIKGKTTSTCRGLYKKARDKTSQILRFMVNSENQRVFSKYYLETRE